MYGYVYITENLVNGKKYIGQHRAKNTDNDRYLGSGSTLKKAIKKYGRENFSRTILAIAETKEELDVLEVATIAEYNAVKNVAFYNLAKGGNYFPSIDYLKRLGEKVKDRWSDLTPDEKIAYAEKVRGIKPRSSKPRTPEHCAAISAAKKGISNWTPEAIASMVEKRKAQIAMGIGVPPQGNRGNKDFRHDENSRLRIKIGVRQARERIFAERDSYFTDEGMQALREKIKAYYTPEQRAEHAQIVREGRARKKAEYEAQGVKPPKYNWFYNPINPSERIYLNENDPVPRGWVKGMGKRKCHKVDYDAVVKLINEGWRNADIARELECAPSRVWQIRHDLKSKYKHVDSPW